ncbi:Hypothetical protein NTJ_02969 [Nesidiocoris tenuis]|uniref:Uncharacterized protein n=1 Tax=Nesidiocoris tenuis TaxID=355587 RepID=A0ABN7AD08_9HEMI|nr:Hypothetical protein NTJ_02969 [Nesidiocoris tenuis]
MYTGWTKDEKRCRGNCRYEKANKTAHRLRGVKFDQMIVNNKIDIGSACLCRSWLKMSIRSNTSPHGIKDHVMAGTDNAQGHRYAEEVIRIDLGPSG